MTRPIVAIALAVAAVVGFALGAWIGTATKPAGGSTAAASPPSPVATLRPTPPMSPTPSLAPTDPPAVLGAPVLELEGTGNQRSPTFDVLVGWQIQWQTDGDHIAIAVTGDQDLGDQVDYPGPAKGVVSPSAGGTFRLEITADGAWSVTVIQGTG